MPSRACKSAAVTVACALLSVGPALSADSPSRADLDQRAAQVMRLIEESSAAHSVADGNGEARAHQARARTLLAEAQANIERHPDLVPPLLEQATREMLLATRLASAESPPAGGSERDFAARETSVIALRDAYRRIVAEKNLPEGEHLLALVERRLTAASAARQSGDLATARRLLDEAYVAVKVGIEEARRGETLVRTLDFASPREEFYYEIDRNDTHRMLIDVLLSERAARDPGLRTQIDAHVAEAAALRVEAEAAATGSDFARAIAALEASTGELQKAIRRAGIYIPG